MENQNFKRKIGAPPGDLIYTGEIIGSDPELHLISFNEQDYLNISTKQVEEIKQQTKKNNVNWINIAGLKNTDVIKSIGEIYDLHPLLLEDILHTNELPKAEEFDNCIFLTFKMLKFKAGSGDKYSIEHISLVLGDNYVISFQEDNTDLFNSIRERIFTAKGKVRKKGADYLFHLLIDIVVDNYFYVLENINDQINNLELELINDQNNKSIQRIVALKKELLYLRKIFQPLRDSIRNLSKDTQIYINKTNKAYFNDIYDHIMNLMSSIESSRETLTGLMDLHMTNLSNKMNEVMKTLTVIATIFIPLTFIAGVYGMNFKYMPELDQKWAYPTIWGLMILITIGMIIFMKRKGFFN